MASLTGNAKGVKLGFAGVAAISAASTIASGFLDPNAHLSLGNDTSGPMYNQRADTFQSAKQTVDEFAYKTIHGDVKLQVHGNIKDANAPITVVDSNNPSNYMIMKSATPASELREYVDGKPDIETMSFFKANHTIDGHNDVDYGYTKDSSSVKAMKVVMSPDMPDAVYEGMLQTAQKIAAERGANLQLQDCSQTHNHIAGFQIKEIGQKLHNDIVDGYGNNISGDNVKVVVLPVTHHQLSEAKKHHDPNTFAKYGDGINPRVDVTGVEPIVDAMLYKNAGSTIQNPQYDQKAPTVNVTVHNDIASFSEPGR